MNYLGICSAVRNYCASIGEEPNIQDDGRIRYRRFFGMLPQPLVDSLKGAGAKIEFNGTSTIVSIPKG